MDRLVSGEVLIILFIRDLGQVSCVIPAEDFFIFIFYLVFETESYFVMQAGLELLL